LDIYDYAFPRDPNMSAPDAVGLLETQQAVEPLGGEFILADVITRPHPELAALLTRSL
jgi:hypothetical protein